MFSNHYLFLINHSDIILLFFLHFLTYLFIQILKRLLILLYLINLLFSLLLKVKFLKPTSLLHQINLIFFLIFFNLILINFFDLIFINFLNLFVVNFFLWTLNLINKLCWLSLRLIFMLIFLLWWSLSFWYFEKFDDVKKRSYYFSKTYGIDK